MFIHVALCVCVCVCVCVQEDLRIALCQGSRLLESINEPLVKDPDYTMNHDELENLATVQRCVCVCVRPSTVLECKNERPDGYSTAADCCVSLFGFCPLLSFRAAVFCMHNKMTHLVKIIQQIYTHVYKEH